MDLLPSNIDLSAAEVQLVGEVAREQSLKRILDPMVEDYDFILIDCQPSLGLLTINALTAADGVIIPLECEYFSLRGVALLIQTIEKVSERLNPQLELEGILATMYDARTLHGREVLSRVVQAFGPKVFHTVVNRTVRFPETTVAGEPITSFAPVFTRRSGVPGPGARGGGPMPRRVILPGADELFRSTGSVQRAPEVDDAVAERGDDDGATSVATEAPTPTARLSGPRHPSGRQRHDEKITVYVSPAELVDLEHARLMLRANHSLAIDRGRIVREALAVVLADLEAKGEQSILVRRLRSR